MVVICVYSLNFDTCVHLARLSDSSSSVRSHFHFCPFLVVSFYCLPALAFSPARIRTFWNLHLFLFFFFWVVKNRRSDIATRFQRTRHRTGTAQGILPLVLNFTGTLSRRILQGLQHSQSTVIYLKQLLSGLPTESDMKSVVMMVAIVLILDYIFMPLGHDLVLYILGYFTFYISHYLVWKSSITNDFYQI